MNENSSRSSLIMSSSDESDGEDDVVSGSSATHTPSTGKSLPRFPVSSSPAPPPPTNKNPDGTLALADSGSSCKPRPVHSQSLYEKQMDAAKRLKGNGECDPPTEYHDKNGKRKRDENVTKFLNSKRSRHSANDFPKRVGQNYADVCYKVASVHKQAILREELEKVLCPVQQRPKDCRKQTFPSEEDLQVVLAISHVLEEGIAFKEKKIKQKKKSRTPGLIYADKAGVGKTSIVWMALSQLKLNGTIKFDSPALIVACNDGGFTSILRHWEEELKLCQVGPGRDSSYQLKVEVADDNSLKNIPKADVYIMSEIKFKTHASIQEWMEGLNIQMVVVDEAHGAGKETSMLRDRIEKLYDELKNVQLLLISADTNWDDKQIKLFKAAIGLSMNMQLPKRIIQRPLTVTDALLPTQVMRLFSTIEYAETESARLSKFKIPTSTPKERVRKKHANVAVAFEKQAEVLANMILDSNGGRWCIWAIEDSRRKKSLRDYLLTRQIKCSVIHASSNDKEYCSQVNDEDYQVLFPPKTHERGVNMYKDIQNVVFFFPHDRQSKNNDVKNQIIGRHKRRSSRHATVNIWEYMYAKTHPYRNVCERYIRHSREYGDENTADHEDYNEIIGAISKVKYEKVASIPVPASPESSVNYKERVHEVVDEVSTDTSDATCKDEECSSLDGIDRDFDDHAVTPNQDSDGVHIADERKSSDTTVAETILSLSQKDSGKVGVSIADKSEKSNSCGEPTQSVANAAFESNLILITSLEDDLGEDETNSMRMEALEDRFKYTIGIAAQLEEISYLRDLKKKGIISTDLFIRTTRRIRQKP